MAKNKLLRNYTQKSDAQLGEYALHIATSLTGNANFATPPITSAALTTQANAFNTAVAACENGTPANTIDKNNKRGALLAVLDTLVTYVELQSNNDAAKLVSSGFSLANPSRVPVAPGTTAILSVTNTASGKLELELQPADNAWCYIVEFTSAPGGLSKLAAFTSVKEVVLTGLAAGTTYSIRVQVMGSGNQATEWSDAVQHMAT
jgi:hypothetical protein